MKSRFLALSAASCALAFAGSSFAVGVPGQGTWETTLLPRDINVDGIVDAYYDTALNITWLADAYVMGGLNWTGALQAVHDFSPYGVSGWRLPTLTDTGAKGCDFSFSGTDCGYNVDPATSDMAHLFEVTLGNVSEYDEHGNLRAGYTWEQSNTGPFRNMQPIYYWTNVWDGGDGAWIFGLGDGQQSMAWGNDPAGVWPVHPGDVGVVSEPGTYALMLGGVCAVGLIARRRRCILLGPLPSAARTEPIPNFYGVAATGPN